MNLLLLVMILGFSTDAAANEALFEKANQAYKDGKFDVALSNYETLLERGVVSGKLHFNIGNAYYKRGHLGRAILHYHKARKYLPNNEDVTANLALVDSQREDPIIEGENEEFSQTVDKLARGFSYTTIFNTALVLLILGGLASLWLVIRPNSGKWLGYVLVIGCTLGLLLTGASYMQYKQLTRQDLGVLVDKQVHVYSGPSTSMNVSFTIHEGIRCRILDEAEGWYRIGLANGYNGWIPRASLEKI